MHLDRLDSLEWERLVALHDAGRLTTKRLLSEAERLPVSVRVAPAAWLRGVESVSALRLGAASTIRILGSWAEATTRALVASGAAEGLRCVEAYGCSNDVLSHFLESVPSVDRVSLRVRDDGARLRPLRGSSVRSVRIHDPSPAELALLLGGELASLEELTITGLRASASTYPKSSRLKALRVAAVEEHAIDPILDACADGLTKLELRGIDGLVVAGRADRLIGLESLRVATTGGPADWLVALPNVRELTLDGSASSDGGVARVPPGLTRFSSSGEVGPGVMRALAEASGLTSLVLSSPVAPVGVELEEVLRRRGAQLRRLWVPAAMNLAPAVAQFCGDRLEAVSLSGCDADDLDTVGRSEVGASLLILGAQRATLERASDWPFQRLRWLDLSSSRLTTEAAVSLAESRLPETLSGLWAAYVRWERGAWDALACARHWSELTRVEVPATRHLSRAFIESLSGDRAPLGALEVRSGQAGDDIASAIGSGNWPVLRTLFASNLESGSGPLWRDIASWGPSLEELEADLESETGRPELSAVVAAVEAGVPLERVTTDGIDWAECDALVELLLNRNPPTLVS